MAVPVPPMTEALIPWLEPRYVPAKPFEATSATREQPHPASAPSELVTPYREGGFLGGARPLDQYLGVGLLRVEHVERGPAAGDLVGLGEAAIGILRHRLGHRHGALDEFAERLRRTVARRHDRLLPADENPQAEVLAL